MDVWQITHAERAALADDLSEMSSERWATPSLCHGWTVRDTLAHMTATAKMNPGRFATKMAASGFRLTRLQEKDIAAERGADGDEALRRFRAISASVGGPPGPKETMLGETFVHSEDIRRPLRMSHAYPPDGVVAAADFFKRTNLIIGSKRRISGLKLAATDADWSVGRGPEVSGPVMSLLMAMVGRGSAYAEDLKGDGATILLSRR
jgi:uncharacterized protein (TIGR03083 family)